VGVGKSNFLRFLVHYPQALNPYLADQKQVIVPVLVDLNVMPAYDLATFYRVILRAIYEARASFEADLAQAIADFYRQSQQEQDPFLPQSALRELFFLLRSKQVKVVLVMDRFDYFCELASPQMFNTLRSLRDSFKDILCYIVGSRYELDYLADFADMSELHELLDGHTCWVGPMEEEDARRLIEEETGRGSIEPTERERKLLLELTGCYPALLKAVSRWWWSTPTKPAARKWLISLLKEQAIQNRLRELWHSLSQEEQLLLSELEKLQTSSGRTSKGQTKAALNKAYQDLEAQHQKTMAQLANRGFCYQVRNQWRINGKLLATFVAEVKERGRGRIWWDETTKEFRQGPNLLQLSPQQQTALHYFLENSRNRLSKSDLIMEVWTDNWEEVNESQLYQLIRQLRKKIEPNPASPRYIIRWSGDPEGGYQFFPEGRGR
jgi:ribosomal 50S subunit-associated protein YjgA (DUF615 family)